jgi:hypothetical protein
MSRSEKSAGSERSVYRAHYDLFVTFILFSLEKIFYKKIPVRGRRGQKIYFTRRLIDRFVVSVCARQGAWGASPIKSAMVADL